MAEFVSAIIGLVAFGVQVGDSLHGLIDTLKEAPKEFRDLLNEITDFRLVLSKLETVRDRGELSENGFQAILQRGEDTLREVDRLVKKLTKQSGHDGQDSQVNRIKWLRRIKQARKLQDTLRWQKSSICNMMVFGTLKSTTTAGASLNFLTLKVESMAEDQRVFKENQELATNRLIQAQSMVQRMIEETRQPKACVEREEEMASSPSGRLENLDRMVSMSVNQTDNGPKTVSGCQTQSSDLDTGKLHHKGIRPSSRASGPHYLRCLDECPCQCHRGVKYRSPRHLSAYIGDLFFGASNLPWCCSSLSECNEQTCRRSKSPSADVKVFLPSWFLSAMASLNICFSLQMIPLRINVQTRNTIPYCSPIFRRVQEGDIHGIRELLLSGKSSLNDVDPYGLGLLYYAAYYGWRSSGPAVALKTCRALLDMGAHADWEDEIGNTPLETMMDDAVISSATRTSTTQHLDSSPFEDIALLFGRCSVELLEEYIESRGFTFLHKALLGIDDSSRALESCLASCGETAHGNSIDEVDCCGRTPLAWAVEYGWPEPVEILLKSGADPSQLRRCIRGESPLLHLAIAAPMALASQQPQRDIPKVVQLLLEAGADVNAVDSDGWTPLHVAASWNSSAIIEQLVRFGDSVVNWEARTNDGESAMELSLLDGGDEAVISFLNAHSTSLDCGLEHGVRTACDLIPSGGLSSMDEDDDESMVDAFYDASDGIYITSPEEHQD